jgi:hypothetical protein
VVRLDYKGIGARTWLVKWGHGLRHSFAQNRMRTLVRLGYCYDTALEIVSQEMGHFRPDITIVYLI